MFLADGAGNHYIETVDYRVGKVSTYVCEIDASRAANGNENYYTV